MSYAGVPVDDFGIPLLAGTVQAKPLQYSPAQINAINGAISQSSGAPQITAPGYSTSSAPTQSPIQKYFGSDPLLDFWNSFGKATAPVYDTAHGAVQTAETAVNILTDIPRLVTIIAGLILLLAGLFLLGARPAVQVVSSVRRTAGAIGALAE